MDSKRMVTQKRIAAQLGLSASTVSRALADDPRIGEPTRKRVAEVASQLGYQPNLLAAGIRTGSTKTIGLVVMDITNPFYGQLARGVEDCAYENGYSVILCDSDFNLDRESLYLTLLQNKRVDGILMTPIGGDKQARQSLVDRGTPYVLVDAFGAGDEASVVTVDHIKGIYLAVRHLIEQGHTRIAFMGGDLRVPPVQMMYRGYQKALSEAKLTADRSWVCQESLEMAGGYNGMVKLLNLKERPTAAVFVSDQTAIAALQALEERGIAVPYEFGIVGYDNIPIAARVNPPLTTIAQDNYELGQISTRILIHEISAGPGCTHQQVLLQPGIVVRGSSVRVTERG
jgi:LacI family transcriptional regulator